MYSYTREDKDFLRRQTVSHFSEKLQPTLEKSKEVKRTVKRYKPLMVSIFMIFLYAVFLLACILTSYESVKSVIKASSEPVSSTKFEHLKTPYQIAPALMLLITLPNNFSNKGDDIFREFQCVCRTYNVPSILTIFSKRLEISFYNHTYTASRRSCEMQTEPLDLKVFYDHFKKNTDLKEIPSFELLKNKSSKHMMLLGAALRGPTDWEHQQQLSLSCNARGFLNGDKNVGKLEYFIVDDYEDIVRREAIVSTILNHQGTKKAHRIRDKFKQVIIQMTKNEITDEESGTTQTFINTEEYYSNPESEDGLTLQLQWKHPIVWKIKSFMVWTPWYAVTVICTMLLTLAEAINVSNKVKTVATGPKPWKQKHESHENNNTAIANNDLLYNKDSIPRELRPTFEQIFAKLEHLDISISGPSCYNNSQTKFS